MSRLGRSQPVQPYAAHGFLGNVPANGTLPPVTVVVVDGNDDRRRKTPPLAPILLVGAVQTPFAAPPLPELIENPPRRGLTLPPTVLSGALGFTVVVVVFPPRPVLVEPDRLRTIRPPFQSVVLRGPAPAPTTSLKPRLMLLGAG